ncbi:MAG: sigma-70 family RNA polymerase sigma factor [Bacteroides sp.]|nr:sigma-70 family RNA polymerase sigma factor [Bacteroides sp.]
MTTFQITYSLSSRQVFPTGLTKRNILRLMLPRKNIFSRILSMLYTSSDRHNQVSATAVKEEKFNLVTREYSDVITRICRSFADKQSDFDDFIQDAYLNIWAGLDSFRGDAQLKTWTYRVTLNTCVATYRKRKRELTQVDIDQARGIAADSGNNFENSQWMNSLLSTLSPIDHSIMTMWLDDLSYDEIAAVMGMNRNTVATRIRRGKESLAKFINR